VVDVTEILERMPKTFFPSNAFVYARKLAEFMA